jgi:hypothetical protein
MPAYGGLYPEVEKESSKPSTRTIGILVTKILQKKLALMAVTQSKGYIDLCPGSRNLYSRNGGG